MCCASTSGSRSSSIARRHASTSEAPAPRSSSYRRSRCCESSSMIFDSRPGLSRSTAKRGCRYSVQSGMVDPRDETHGADESLPGIALAREHAATLRRQTVKAPPPLACLLHPSALQPATFFQPIQERIERRDVELELPGRLTLDQLADLVSMPGAGFDDREDDQFGRALLQFTVQHARVDSCHSHIC